MSGELISTLGGKIPQRALRHLDQLPYVVNYQSLTVVDFGNTGDTEGFVFATPATKRGKPIQVDLYDNAEAFGGGTSAARVDIGDGSDADEFAYTDGAAASAVAQVFCVADGTLNIGDTEIIQPGDQVTVTCVDATGTSLAGQAAVGVTVLYFE